MMSRSLITIAGAAVRTIDNTTVLEKFSIKTETSRLSGERTKEQGIKFLIANRTQPLLQSLSFLKILNEGRESHDQIHMGKAKFLYRRQWKHQKNARVIETE